MKLLVIASFLSFALHCSAQQVFPYQLNKPVMQRTLPEILNEVSGLTDLDSAHVACVQDEIGTVFVYNFRTGNMVSEHVFEEAGDFEGVSYTGSSLFILRSDGRLSEWAHFGTDSAKMKHYKLPLLTSDNEGLCYDEKYNRILIAAKNKPQDQNVKEERFIYAFDLARKKLLEKPVYSLNTKKLNTKAKQYNIQLKEKGNGGEKPLNFRPASLSVHPLTGDFYIISAADMLLVVMNREGEVLHMEQLDPQRFAKAEGITFLSDGTMIITNEAVKKASTLLVYKMIGER